MKITKRGKLVAYAALTALLLGVAGLAGTAELHAAQSAKPDWTMGACGKTPGPYTDTHFCFEPSGKIVSR